MMSSMLRSKNQSTQAMALVKSVPGFEQIPVQGASYADDLDQTIAQIPNTDVVYVEEQKPEYTSQLVKSVSGVEHIPTKTSVQGDSYADDLKTIVQVPNTDVIYVEEQKPDYTSQLVKSVSVVEQIPVKTTIKGDSYLDVPTSYADQIDIKDDALIKESKYVDDVHTQKEETYEQEKLISQGQSYGESQEIILPISQDYTTDVPNVYAQNVVPVVATKAPEVYVATKAPEVYVATKTPEVYGPKVAMTTIPMEYKQEPVQSYSEQLDNIQQTYTDDQYDDGYVTEEINIPHKGHSSTHVPFVQRSVVIADIKTPTLDLCSQCEEVHGVGYAPVAGLCDAYLQCVFHGGAASQVFVKYCPAGTMWNQDILNCDFPDNVACVSTTAPNHIGVCPTRHSAFDDVTAFFEYYNNQWNRLDCPYGMAYNNVTCQCSDKIAKPIVDGCMHKDMKAIPGDSTGYMQKVHDMFVRMPCPATLHFDPDTCRCDFPSIDNYAMPTTTPSLVFGLNQCPDKQVIPDDNSGYLQLVNGAWLRMPCPATLVFDTDFCRCDYPKAGVVITKNLPSSPVVDTCKPTLKITFDHDTSDSSPNKWWVNNTGVKVINGEGHFDGKSRLTVPAFSNMELGDDLCILVRYKQAVPMSLAQTLVSNGDCGDAQSVGVCAGPQDVHFYAETYGSD